MKVMRIKLYPVLMHRIISFSSILTKMTINSKTILEKESIVFKNHII